MVRVDIDNVCPGSTMDYSVTSQENKPPLLPMAVVSELTDSNESAKGHFIYFQSEGIAGPGFGNDIPEILESLGEIQGILEDQGEGIEFFISMIPSSFIDRYHPRMGQASERSEVPNFKGFFSPIFDFLRKRGIAKCRVAIDIQLEDRWSKPIDPSLRLSIWEILDGEPKNCIDARQLGIEIDINSPACQTMIGWYKGCRGGRVSWIK